MSALKFENAEVSFLWGWTNAAAAQLPSALMWKPASVENGRNASKHKPYLFIRLVAPRTAYKYSFGGEIDLGHCIVWKYDHITCGHSVLLRVVKAEVKVELRIEFAQLNHTQVTASLDGYQVFTTLVPKVKAYKVGDAKKSITKELLVRNHATKQTKIKLVSDGRVLNSNKVIHPKRKAIAGYAISHGLV